MHVCQAERSEPTACDPRPFKGFASWPRGTGARKTPSSIRRSKGSNGRFVTRMRLEPGNPPPRILTSARRSAMSRRASTSTIAGPSEPAATSLGDRHCQPRSNCRTRATRPPSRRRRVLRTFPSVRARHGVPDYYQTAEVPGRSGDPRGTRGSDQGRARAYAPDPHDRPSPHRDPSDRRRGAVHHRPWSAARSPRSARAPAWARPPGEVGRRRLIGARLARYSWHESPVTRYPAPR
jgi:hypothetical protein